VNESEPKVVGIIMTSGSAGYVEYESIAYGLILRRWGPEDQLQLAATAMGLGLCPIGTVTGGVRRASGSRSL